ncbi:hypothetical protein D881_01895 [Corynebacterium ulcerans NCTC 12077]|uniref:Uncharacterized protein n=1 Tax=Corynebacterium ulcerans FRC58 TaxID=1408268 RepID=A0ABN4GWM8_CORUL|nr:hypothetical protein [Corynebacterium ulcerans]AKN76148.1 Hypothetical protein CulFRC58_0294 [Corynebacterium ulcerans FRC58]ESU59434.1 hypothetical protein D881_01895 [Corynebacterium ulcerans NCTC 12077]
MDPPNVEISMPDDNEFYERQYETLKRALLAAESDFDRPEMTRWEPTQDSKKQSLGAQRNYADAKPTKPTKSN